MSGFAFPVDSRKPTKNKKGTSKGTTSSDKKTVKYDPNDPLAQLIAENGISVDTETGILYANDDLGSPKEHFFYVPEGGGEALLESKWHIVQNKIIADYTASGKLDSLFSTLYAKNLIDKRTFETKDVSTTSFAKGLQSVVAASGVQTFYKHELQGASKTAPSLFEFLAKVPNKASTGPVPTRYITTRPDSDEEADRFFIENVGRKATVAEKENYYKTLHAAESKAVVSTKDGTTTGSHIDEADRTVMLSKIAGNAIAGADVNVLLKSGGLVAQGINDLKTYSKSYGITLSDMQALGHVVDALKTGKDMKSKKAKILKLAKIKYANLSDSIDDDTSIEDIANETMYAISKLTGIPYNSLSVDHSIVQKALANNGKPGVMANHEVEFLVRNSPETRQKWLETPAAREEAAGYATNILKTFGLI